ncbi:hypothetical protein DL93DRAFT_2084303 [Clavulina sp. PMI_390]|nr:hypothetical protein DL93DRAFT_2084303 [Clavulina sp. PMI_390]
MTAIVPLVNNEASYYHQAGGHANAQGAEGGAENGYAQQSDNHYEVELQRREAIEKGISELHALLPPGDSTFGEDDGATILTRAVQYIRALKENEMRNIERWTLEKLLMDQAIGDAQVAADEKQKWLEEERAIVASLNDEVDVLRAQVASFDEVNV